MESWLRSMEADPAFVYSNNSTRQMNLIAANMETGGSLTRLATSQIR